MKMPPSRSVERIRQWRRPNPAIAAILLLVGALTTVTAFARTRDGIEPIRLTNANAGDAHFGVQLAAAAAIEAVEPDEPGDTLKSPPEKDIGAGDERGARFAGFYQLEGAYTTPSPAHFSKLRNRLEASWSGQLSENLKW